MQWDKISVKAINTVLSLYNKLVWFSWTLVQYDRLSNEFSDGMSFKFTSSNLIMTKVSKIYVTIKAYLVIKF